MGLQLVRYRHLAKLKISDKEVLGGDFVQSPTTPHLSRQCPDEPTTATTDVNVRAVSIVILDISLLPLLQSGDRRLTMCRREGIDRDHFVVAAKMTTRTRSAVDPLYYEASFKACHSSSSHLDRLRLAFGPLAQSQPLDSL